MKQIKDNIKHRVGAVQSKWSRGRRGKLAVSAIRNDAVRQSTTLVLENIDNFKEENGNFLIEEGSTIGTYGAGTGVGAGNVNGAPTTGENSAMYRPLSLALARRVYPSLFAHKLVGVQPMAAPVGIAFAMRNKYVNPKSATGAFLDKDAAWKAIPEYAGFSGGYVGANVKADGSVATGADIVTSATEITVVYAGTAGVAFTATAATVTVAAANKAALTDADKVIIADETRYLNTAIVATVVKAGTQTANGTGDQLLARGISTTNAEKLGIRGDFGGPDTTAAGSETSTWNELGIQFDKKTIEAKERTLAASFSLQSMQDIKALHDIDLKAEVVDTLQYETTAELDRELLGNLKATSIDTNNGGGDVLSLDLTPGSGDIDNRQATALLVNGILYAANTVAKETKRGRANFVVVSNKVATVLQSAVSVFSANTAKVDPGIILSGSESTEIGKLNNAITVYLDQFAETEYALVGYKGGEKQSDSGVIFSPYVMGVKHEAVAQENFKPRIGVMSRYAVTTGLLDAGCYYRSIVVTGLDGVVGITEGQALKGW